MGNKCALVCSLALLFCHQATAADRLKVVSTTTLNAETSYNTSTADSFTGTPKGNPAAGNDRARMSENLASEGIPHTGKNR